MRRGTVGHLENPPFPRAAHRKINALRGSCVKIQGFFEVPLDVRALGSLVLAPTAARLASSYTAL